MCRRITGTRSEVKSRVFAVVVVASQAPEEAVSLDHRIRVIELGVAVAEALEQVAGMHHAAGDGVDEDLEVAQRPGGGDDDAPDEPSAVAGRNRQARRRAGHGRA